ncbi:FAD-dependent monooxygenase [Gloeocapsopsis crepidinum LEGE 06123]|uniref:FAD-dependent monooxygenase n=2 Tax=Gloeocapsopsis crepidinum TaxID=693223 RepID=A0ABR9UR08_9CHRO|nr:NAD(P)/FAD-dependent oxidoreductase [Gloeocapsopsis crepidinum]MBE9190712.1 FAD-dependent monooxygenase [Gloeocapsopsis crepidinum LEGE 06123]
MSKPLRIAVIGAGVAGCLIVRGLQQLEVEIFCIEKGPEENLLAGTGLNVGPNALKILQQIDPELAAALQTAGTSLPWNSWKAGLTDGRVIFDLPLLQVADNPGIRIRWSQLYRQLRSHLTNVYYNTTVVEMGYTHSSAPLYLVVEDQVTGERHQFHEIDLILGCDGRYSQVRQTFIDTPQPAHLGTCIYRLLVPNTPQLIDDYQQWFHNGSRLLAFSIPGDEVYIAGSFPIAADLVIPEIAKSPDFLWQCYKPQQGYSQVCEFLVTAICENIEQIHWARIQEIPPAFGDARGHILCLGDSSHAMFPTLGQGATQAFEDGCFFVAQVRRYLAHQRNFSVPALVESFTATRRDRIKFVQQFSRDASDSLLAGSNPITELQAKTQNSFLEKLRRLYRDTPNCD